MVESVSASYLWSNLHFCKGAVVIHFIILLFRYIRTWLIIDIISSFPFDNLILWITGGDTDSYGLGVKSAFRGFKFLRLVKLLSLLKLLRLSRILRFVAKYEDVSFFWFFFVVVETCPLAEFRKKSLGPSGREKILWCARNFRIHVSITGPWSTGWWNRHWIQTAWEAIILTFGSSLELCYKFWISFVLVDPYE